MNIVDCAKTRYATKVFDPTKKLTDTQVQDIKDIARYAPSSINTQPWHFILASTDETKQRIIKSMPDNYQYNVPKITDSSHVMVICARTHLTDDYLDTLTAQEGADGRLPNDKMKQLIIDTRLRAVTAHKNKGDTAEWLKNQVYIAIGGILLGAKALNIDALPLEGFDKDIFDAEFNLTEQGLTSAAMIALGYRSTEDFNAPLPKSRLPEEKIFTEC